MKWKAVCFDIDGTLYPISDMKKRLVSLFLRHPVSNIRYSRSRRTYRKKQKDMTIRDFYRQEALFSFVHPPESEKLIQKRKEQFKNKIYKPMGKKFSNITPYFGVAETFKSLSERGIKIGILSDFPLFTKAEALGIAPYCDFMISSCDTGYLKPDVRAFIPLIKGIEMEKGDILFVGDIPNKDIIGAEKAGLSSVLVNSTIPKADSFGAVEVFEKWKDFSSWILEE